MILAPLRGVTIRCFRKVFADVIREVGFTEAITPFVTANAGVDPLKDRELRGPFVETEASVLITPQFIGKDPVALRHCLERIRSAGYTTADLNCGCPFPMVRNKGRGSGILRTPEVFERMLAVGCETMGEGKFSIKARLGIDRNDELLHLMPIINQFPLRMLTVHARTARQMYEGDCDTGALAEIERNSRVRVVRNGDIAMPAEGAQKDGLMIGRAFIRYLGERSDASERVCAYVEATRQELSGDRPALGRLKELLSYWQDLPYWSRRWQVIKLARTVDELLMSVGG